MKLNKYAKAVVAMLIAGVASLQFATADDVISTAEWVGIAAAALSGLGITWAVPNAPAEEPFSTAPTARRGE